MRLTRRQIIAGAVITACAGLGAGIWAALPEDEPRTTKVVWADVRQTAAVPGRTEAAAVYRLYFGATLFSAPGAGQTADDACGPLTHDPGQAGPGPVTSVAVGAGAGVTQGQELAVADTTAAQAYLTSAQTELATAQQDLDQAQQLLAREQAPVAQPTDAPSPQAGGDGQVAAHAAVSTDHDRVARATQRVAQAQKALNDARITAPVDGVVQSVGTAPGVSPSCRAPAFLLRPNALQVVAEVPGSLLTRLAVGQQVIVTLPQLDRSVGTTITVVPLQAVAAGSPAATASAPPRYGLPGPTTFAPGYSLAVTVQKPPTNMIPGMPATLTIVFAEHRHVLAVPSSAVHHRADGDYVTLSSSVVPKCHDCEVRVTTGLVGDAMTEITDGLLLGDTVVIPDSVPPAPSYPVPESSASPSPPSVPPASAPPSLAP